jgi:signal transduction histidine kinase
MQVAARTRAAVENQELDIVRSDGSTIHTLSYSAPVFDENGNVRGVIDACIDITDRKRSEEERRSFLARRRELEQRVERGEKYHSLALMAGGIAHDFNNLLTVIIGHANVLATDLPKFSDIGRSAADILAAANRAAELTSKLVAFTGHIWCDARPVNLSAEVFAMQPAMREMVPPATELRFDLCPDLPVVHAGIPELQQVVHNLLENAAEALDGHPGVIEIRTSQCELSAGDLGILFPEQPLAAGRYVRLEVTDNGCGIPEEISGRIFDPFFTTKFVGRGLGLSAVQGIVRAHSGAIRVESSMHHGTRVEVVLPVEHSLEFKGLGDVYSRSLST